MSRYNFLIFATICFVSFSALAAPPAATLMPALNCDQFWTDTAGLDLPCDEFTSTGFPATIGGSEIRIFHYSTGWNDELGQRQLLAAVSDAARNSASQYGRWFSLPKIYFVLHNEIVGKELAQANWLPPTSPESCRIDLFFNMPNSRDLAMQITAHEMFHCTQGHGIRFPTSAEVSGKLNSWAWWVEGTADYMSSKLFPAGGRELINGAAYKPQLPLYRQPNPYSTVVFWDFLEGYENFNYGHIGDLLKAQPTQSTFAAERQALGQFPDIDRLFAHFAAHVVDRDIHNVMGKSYNLPITAFGTPIDFDVTWDHLDQPVVPFTVNAGALRFPSGTHLKWGLSKAAAEQRLQISYRVQGTKLWQRMRPGSYEIVSAPCNQPEGLIYEYVITSTADSGDAVTGKMAFKEVTAKECLCKDTAQPLDPCLHGKWELDDAALAAYLMSNFGQAYQRIDVTGLMQLDIRSLKSTTMTFNQYRTYILEASSGSEVFEQEAIANGTVETTILMQRNGELCLRPGVASGTYSQRFNDAVKNSSLAEVIQPDPSQPEQHWRYTCDAHKLHFKFNASPTMVFEWDLNKK